MLDGLSVVWARKLDLANIALVLGITEIDPHSESYEIHRLDRTYTRTKVHGIKTLYYS